MPGLDGIICGGLDTRKISADDILVSGAANKPNVWVKAEVLDKVYKYQNKYYAVIKFNDACVTTLCPGETDFNRSLLLLSDSINLATGVDKTNIPTSGVKTICGSIEGMDQQKFQGNAIKAVDATNVNKYGFFPKAIKPTKAAIPVRSNYRTYGPYVSPGFSTSCGGINVEQDTDLAPWVFGSVATMNNAGATRVASMLQTFSSPIQETGSYTITGLPTLNLGINPSMPNLTGISINFGSSGLTTTYSFQTHTNKFGSLSRNFLEKFKTVQKYKQQMLQFKNNLSVQQERSNRKRKIIDAGGGGANNGNFFDIAGHHRASEQRILVGEIYDHKLKDEDAKSRTVVSTASLDKSIYELREDYDKKAFMSLDGLFGPVSIYGDGGLPQYAGYATRCHKTSADYSQPPFVVQSGSSSESSDIFANGLDQYNLEITNLYENPLTNPGSHHHDGDTMGHSIDYVAGGSEVPEKGMIRSFISESDSARYSEDYRFLGLRGPMVLHAWGYDTQGKPIPNEADNETDASTGNFVDTNLKDRFLKDWLKFPSTWPVAPVDLRFDRNRGVWVSPPSYKLVVAKLEEDLPEYGTAKAKLINSRGSSSYGSKIYDSDGDEVPAEDENSKAIIKVADRIGKSASKNDLVYCYYDTFNCEYLILTNNTDKIIRFKLVDICPKDSIKDPSYGDAFTSKYGYGDKYFDNGSEYSDSYALKINCNGKPIDKDGNVLSNTDLEDENKVKENLIIVRDSVGRWGPAFNRMYDTTVDKASSIAIWKEHAAEGYAVKLPAASGTENSCDNKLPCELEYMASDAASGDEAQKVDEEYNILYLESYARVIHGCLEQDLYCSSTFANQEYPTDEWKKNRSMGNALVSVDKYYGNSPNGKKPIFLKKSAGGALAGEPDINSNLIRVFDPWMVSNENYDDGSNCYDPKESIFYHLSKGTNIVAIFNEKLKRYEIIQASKPKSNIVRFKVIDICESGSGAAFGDPADGYPFGDSWTKYAGFLDKFPNVHVLGVRIDCDGNPVDKNGNLLPTNNQAFLDAISDEERSKDILINLFDNAGSHGPSYSTFTNYSEWKSKAFTGYAAKADPKIHDSNCDLGRMVGHCRWVDNDLYESFDILFIESYARFVECELTQDLYVSSSGSSGGSNPYPDDEYKTDYLDGNASATILNFYGNSPNGRVPEFYNKDGEEVPFRVFDPFEDVDKRKNPFALLKEGDKVLAVFDEDRKKYVIYQSIDKVLDRIVKFALAQKKKKFGDQEFYGVLVDALNYPIDASNNRLTAENFLANRIIIRDTFGLRGPNMAGIATPYTSGPAIGSDIFSEHIDGIADFPYEEKFGPFLGFALETTYNGPDQNGLTKGQMIYEVITLESFATHVSGKIGTPSTDSDGYYYGAINGFFNGRKPLTRSTKDITKGLNVILGYDLTQFNGTRSYIVGDFKDGQSAESGNSMEDLFDKIDGCEFIAELVCDDSLQDEEKLIYTITESETLAIRGSGTILDQENIADELNQGNPVNETDDNSYVSSNYYQGFQWSKQDSKEHYNGILIYNRNDWINKPLLVKNTNIYTELVGIDGNTGNPIYQITDAKTVAKIVEKKSINGKNASSFASQDDLKLNHYDRAYMGSNEVLSLDSPPKLEISQQWMSYEEGLIIAALDEENRSSGVLSDKSLYRILYAREAPVIITCLAVNAFTPTDTSGIKLVPSYASCPNVDKAPIPDPLLQNVVNPMGYGAGEGDSVTVQRVYSPALMFGVANYYYMVIGTGQTPEDCSTGGY